MTVQLLQGDCVDVMATLPENSVDSIVGDPPYGLEFMGKEWDSLHLNEPFSDAEAGGLGGYKHHIRYGADGRAMQDWHYRWALAALRVAKPGAILMAFGGTRTWHRLACALEDAGWEIRDTMMWLYGSGFPKSRDISKAIDKSKGAERKVVGSYIARGYSEHSPTNDGRNMWAAGKVVDKPTITTTPATPLAAQWNGWGSALKPAFEPVILAQKPLDGTYAQNAETWGVAGLWIEGGRVDSGGTHGSAASAGGGAGPRPGIAYSGGIISPPHPAGRWPANLILDEAAAAMLDEQSGVTMSRQNRLSDGRQNAGNSIFLDGRHDAHNSHTDAGGASRFFYCAKASKRERDMGCEDLPITRPDIRTATGMGNFEEKGVQPGHNAHPTVKPLSLMRYLVRLSKTPTGGVVLDPFMGSGTTGMACVLEGRDFIGIEKEAEYMEIARRRIAACEPEPIAPMLPGMLT